MRLLAFAAAVALTWFALRLRRDPIARIRRAGL